MRAHKLKDSSFPVEDVSPELIKTLDKYNMIFSERELFSYQQYIPLFRDSGRYDLVDALNQVFDLYHTKHKKMNNKEHYIVY
jgi:hypothetical protein